MGVINDIARELCESRDSLAMIEIEMGWENQERGADGRFGTGGGSASAADKDSGRGVSNSSGKERLRSLEKEYSKIMSQKDAIARKAGVKDRKGYAKLRKENREYADLEKQGDATIREQLKIEDALKREADVASQRVGASVSPKQAGLDEARDSVAHKQALSRTKKSATVADREIIKKYTRRVERLGELEHEIALREQGERKNPMSADAKQWNATLDKMPQYEGVVYRGLNMSEKDALKNFKTGKTITNDVSSSATKSGQTAAGYLESSGVVMRVKQSSGADISSLETVKNKEVVLRKGAKYKVTKINNPVTMSGIKAGGIRSPRVIVVDLEEV